MKKELAHEYITLIPNLFGSFSELNKNATELSHMQNHVIEYLFMNKRAFNLKEISTGLDIAKQQLTNVVSALEVQGYLVKKPDPKDKRAVLIALTPKGKEVQEKKWAEIYNRFSQNLTKLNEEEQRDLQFALHKVNVLLTKMEG
ncbi:MULTISPECIES: MarR family winged helix-turn-helix transcriptional regulator [Fictibacillus]|uniref:MarR family transcriptional regulator n=1 Tax=Fictibacillus enclensis TaxID=1017270 RepID=A0A0V8J1X5_9BACL|nr:MULTISPECIES: winged helix DNA-binding protein [Fictibacillus]KSU81090.1 MarR family transcriptional regulator [Fictibacillus enclensis]RXZ00616.1 MarR family transcriptional regulator [Fictibacillus sp. S7]SCC34949.1 DNA-binding transcriptional regulator, MarR family [Fictibacillus enclensis]